jgi:uncharacterized cupin superfamily protein
VTLAHWDDVEPYRRAKGEMDATWQFLGAAAGTRGVGVHRVCVAPGALPTPPHLHRASEEVFFVLGGSGLAWQDGSAHEVRPGDCVIYRANELAHTFVAGSDGLDYLVFGTRHPAESGWLPRSRAVLMRGAWVEGRDDDPWDAEAASEPLAYGEPAPRPANIVNVDEVAHEVWRGHSRPRRWRRASARSWRGCTGSRSRRAGAAPCRTAIPKRRRCSSSSTARRRSSCGPRRVAKRRARRERSSPCVPATWSRGLPGRGSRTRSSPAPRA